MINTFRDVIIGILAFWVIVFLIVWGVVQYV